MPFNTRAAFKLTLAVTAAISAQTLHAAEDPERLWSCNLTPTGEWDCEVNNTLMQQTDTVAEPAPVQTQTPAAASRKQTAGTTPVTQPVDNTPQVATEVINTATSMPTAINWPQPPAKPQTPPTAAPSVVSTAAQNEWDCVASGDSWDCNQPTSRQAASVARDMPASGQISAQTSTAEPEWNCAASNGEWACEEVPGSTPVAAAVARSSVQPITPASAAALDWYAYAPGEAPGACHGRYIEPEFAFLDDDRPLDQQPVYVNALTSSTEIGGITNMEGGIQVQRGGRLITSTRGEYDQNTSTARLFGEVRYREQGLLLLGDQADSNMLSGDTRFSNAQYVLHQEHMRGQAQQITRYGDRRIRLDEGAITYCEPGSNAWQIAAGSIELNPETGRGVARNATLDIAGIPILYTPYMSFPIDDRRQSGFLYPSISYSVSDGVDLSIPYYFNLAANFDDTLTLRHIGERGLLLENEFRYMSRWSHNSLNTAWLGSDSRYEDDRWLLGFDHSGTPLDNLHSRIDFARVSDDDYFEDLGTSLEIQRDDHLDQLFELRYLQPGWNLTLRSQSYQTIDGTTPYESVPQLLLTGYQTRIGGMFDLDYRAEYTRYERDLESRYAPLIDVAQVHNQTTGDRLHLRPRISMTLERPWGYVRPAASVWHTQYNLENDTFTIENKPSINASLFSIDSGLTFEREYATDAGTYTQTLEPRLLLLSAQADEQGNTPLFDSAQLDFSYYNLFHETGWSGNDRVADTQQATLGLSSAMYSEQGIEKLRFGAAQAYYFKDRDYPALRPGDLTGQESTSNLATLASWSVTPHLQLTHSGEIDRNGYELLEHNYKLSYMPDSQRLLYLSYRDNLEKYTDNPSSLNAHQQLDMAFRWPLNRSWTGYGRWQQDLENNENLETLLGVEYASCCWKVRLTGRSWVVDPDTVGNAEEFETDNGIFLQFVLRGLGTFGQGDGREFLEDITGYNEDENGAF